MDSGGHRDADLISINRCARSTARMPGMSVAVQIGAATRLGAWLRISGVARAGLIVGWLVFWLNAALFPCCDAMAAILSGHAEGGMRPSSSASSSPHPEYENSESSDQCPDAPCGEKLGSVPVPAGKFEVNPPDRSPAVRIAADLAVAMPVEHVFRAPKIGVSRAPPSSLRHYLRTRRLRI